MAGFQKKLQKMKKNCIISYFMVERLIQSPVQRIRKGEFFSDLPH
jgi:hypothetical protein